VISPLTGRIVFYGYYRYVSVVVSYHNFSVLLVRNTPEHVAVDVLMFVACFAG